MTKEQFEAIRKINHYRYVDLFVETRIPVTCLRKFKMSGPHMEQLQIWYDRCKNACDIDWQYLTALKVYRMDYLIGLKKGTWDKYAKGSSPSRANYLKIKAFELKRKREEEWIEK